jgi:hypothetical protein
MSDAFADHAAALRRTANEYHEGADWVAARGRGFGAVPVVRISARISERKFAGVDIRDDGPLSPEVVNAALRQFAAKYGEDRASLIANGFEALAGG